TIRGWWLSSLLAFATVSSRGHESFYGVGSTDGFYSSFRSDLSVGSDQPGFSLVIQASRGTPAGRCMHLDAGVSLDFKNGHTARIRCPFLGSDCCNFDVGLAPERGSGANSLAVIVLVWCISMAGLWGKPFSRYDRADLFYL